MGRTVGHTRWMDVLIISGHNCQATYAVKKEQFHTEIGLLQKLLLWVCDLNPLITGFKPVNKTALSGPYI